MIEDQINWQAGCPHVDHRFALFCHADSKGAVPCLLAYGRGPCVVDLGEWGAWRASLAYFMDASDAFESLSGAFKIAAENLTTVGGLERLGNLIYWHRRAIEEVLEMARAIGWSA